MGINLLTTIICCCQEEIKSIIFELKHINLNIYNIVLVKTFEINGYTDVKEEIIIENIEKKDELITFIELINKIFNNNNAFSKKNISYIVKCFKNILSEHLKQDDQINHYLNNINNLSNNKYNIKDIKYYISLITLIYNKKNEISRESIIYFIKSIDYLFKDEKLLTEEEINFFIEQLKEIFLGGKKSNEMLTDINLNEKKIIKNNSRSDIATISYNIEEKKTINENENKSIKSSRSYTSYSQDSQKQINKMESEINDLKLEIERSMIKYGEKKILNKIKFLDENEKEEYLINIYLNDNSKCSSIIEAFYEEYPFFEEKKIKFSINGKTIKRNELIKNIGLNNSSLILIEHWD